MVIVVIGLHRVAELFRSLKRDRVKAPSWFEGMLNLENLGGLLSLGAELSIDEASLRNLALEQKVLPSLDFERHVLATPLQKKWHCKPLKNVVAF